MKKIKLNKKSIALVATTVMLAGVGRSTLAWLMDDATPVTNEFTTSDIAVYLDEDENVFKMIPGWSIDKDPVAYVSSASEDCYLFIQVTERCGTETSNPDNNVKVIAEDESVATYTFDDFIDYKIDTTVWQQLKTDDTDEDVPNVYYIVIDEDTEKGQTVQYSVLGSGAYELDKSFTWEKDQVLTKPTVTKEMLNAVNDANRPTLTFTAYAVQLWKTNEPASTATDAEKNAAKFSPYEAWQKLSSN